MNLKYLEGYSSDSFEIKHGFYISKNTKKSTKISNIRNGEYYIGIYGRNLLLCAIHKNIRREDATSLISYYKYNKRKKTLEELGIC